MAKKKKHKSKSNPAARLPQSPPDLEQDARRALAEKRYPAAIEIFKQLLKREDRQEWREALARAYQQRACELNARGMCQEALGVLENIPVRCRLPIPPGLRLDSLLGAGKLPEALALYLNRDSGMPALAPESEALLAAFVLSAPTEALHILPGDHPLAVDRRRILSALQALAQGNDALCKEQLQHIGFRSPYKDFRLLLSGLLALYRHENAEALARLRNIPSSSALSELATALIQILSADDPEQAFAHLAGADHPVQAQLSLAVLGREELKAEFFDRVKHALHRKDYRPVFIALKKNLQAFEPSRARRFAAAMLAHDFTNAAHYQSIFGPLSQFDLERMRAKHCESATQGGQAIEHWRHCFALATPEVFPDPQDRQLAQALILRKISSIKLALARERNEFGLDDDDDWDDEYDDDWDDEWDDEEDEDPGHGEASDWLEDLQESLRYDASDKNTYLQLIAYYHSVEDKTNLGKWIKILTQQFPDDVDALLLYANDARARKAYKTALDTLRHLLEIDPINQNAIASKIHIHLSKARKHIQEKKFHLARKEFAEAAASEEFRHCDGTLRLKWGLMELLAGNAEQGHLLLQEGRRLHGDHLGTLLVLDIEASRIGLKNAALNADLERLEQTLRAPATAENAARIAQALMIYHDTDYARKPVHQSQAHKYLERAKKCAFDQVGFLQVCDYLSRGAAHLKIFQDYAKRAADTFPQVPRFVFYRCLAKSRGMSLNLAPRDCEDLVQAAQRAQQSGDLQTAQEIRNLMGPLQGLLSQFGPGSAGAPRGPGSLIYNVFNSLLDDLGDFEDDSLEDLDEEDFDFGPRRRKPAAKCSTAPKAKGKAPDDNQQDFPF